MRLFTWSRHHARILIPTRVLGAHLRRGSACWSGPQSSFSWVIDVFSSRERGHAFRQRKEISVFVFEYEHTNVTSIHTHVIKDATHIQVEDPGLTSSQAEIQDYKTKTSITKPNRFWSPHVDLSHWCYSKHLSTCM